MRTIFFFTLLIIAAVAALVWYVADQLAYPVYLFALFIIPYLIYNYTSKRTAAPMRYSDIKRVKETLNVRSVRTPITHTIRHALYGLRLIVLSLFIIAMARPQAEIVTSDIYTEGVDIILTVDVSGSMNLIDLDVNKRRTRLQVTKEAVESFIQGRRNDRIGMVVFASEAYLQCPLTVDYGIVQTFLDNVKIGMVPQTSTAIGNAIASSLNRLVHTEAKSKVVVLLTDGANNAGQIDPLTAADMAAALDVTIYTIGVGGYEAPYVLVEDFLGKRLQQQQGAERIDEETLKQIANKTNGQYFRATNTEELHQIFTEIDELEKTEIKTEGHRRFRELFPYVLVPALILLLLEVFLSQTRFRKLP